MLTECIRKKNSSPNIFRSLEGEVFETSCSFWTTALKKKLRENHVHVLLGDFNQTPAYTLKIQTLKLKSDKEGLKNL